MDCEGVMRLLPHRFPFLMVDRIAMIDGNRIVGVKNEDVKWRKPVRPGDVLIIDVELTKMRGKIGKAKGVCKVQDETVSEAEVTFMIREA